MIRTAYRYETRIFFTKKTTSILNPQATQTNTYLYVFRR